FDPWVAVRQFAEPAHPVLILDGSLELATRAFVGELVHHGVVSSAGRRAQDVDAPMPGKAQRELDEALHCLLKLGFTPWSDAAADNDRQPIKRIRCRYFVGHCYF